MFELFSPDRWDYYQDYLMACFEIIKGGDNTCVESCYNFINEVSKMCSKMCKNIPNFELILATSEFKQ